MTDPSKTMSKSKLVILSNDDDDGFELILDGVPIGQANHDSDGWQGMEKIKRLMYILGDRLDFDIEERQPDETEA